MKSPFSLWWALKFGLVFLVLQVGGTLAAITSALVNLPLIARVGKQRRLTMAVGRALLLIAAVGLVGAVIQSLVCKL